MERKIFFFKSSYLEFITAEFPRRTFFKSQLLAEKKILPSIQEQ